MDVTDLSAEDLRRLNSATRYPSIPTYHAIGQRGRLAEERTVEFGGLGPGELEVTEKIDGTNARIVLHPGRGGRAIIGSRTELLHCRGDVIANPAQGIVETVAGVADAAAAVLERESWLVLFGEVYGGRSSGGAKNYTGDPTRTGFALFDVAVVGAEVLGRDRAQIASWRDGGGQEFAGPEVRARTAQDVGLAQVPLLESVPAPPESVADTQEWLRNAIETTHAALDGSAALRPEGVVLRSADRSRIAKVRFEDYARTLKPGRR